MRVAAPLTPACLSRPQVITVRLFNYIFIFCRIYEYIPGVVMVIVMYTFRTVHKQVNNQLLLLAIGHVH